MSKLHKLQGGFRDALLGDDTGLMDTQIRADGLPPEYRLGIYRNNVFTNLREALRALFPVIERLVGKEFFDYTADAYIRLYPSPAGDLNQFGEHLAEFLVDFEPASGLPYLADMAGLEWLVHKVYHAAEHNELAIDQLATLAPEHYGELHFILNPASALFKSTYPLHRIWQVNQPGYAGDPVVNLNAGGVKLLIERRAGLIELQTLNAGEWALLESLAADDVFATACDKALHAEPSFDLGNTLTRLVTQATLADFRICAPLTPKV